MIPYRKTLWAGTFSLFLAGCGGGGNSALPVSRAATLHGTAHGGQSPITASTVTLYAVGSGAAAVPIATTATDANGDFDFGSGVTCDSPGLTPASLIYVTASGGNPGAGEGVDNTAINLMAALGQCQNATTVDIDEVTTVAAAYALAGFTVDSGGSILVQASATNGIGLANAFATAAILADPVSGATPAALGISQPVAQQTVNGLANALAACVNTTGGGSSQCTALFACAVPGASFDGTSSCSGGSVAAPGETFGAVLSVVQNPGLVPAGGVYQVATRNAVFSPTLGAAPNDWTLALTISGAGLNYPVGLAIDASGDVWVANAKGPSLTELLPNGSPAAGSPFSGTGISAPWGIALDASGNVWITNFGNSVATSSVTELPVAGPPAVYTGGGINGPFSVAIDASGDAWVANFAINPASSTFSGGGVTEITSTGVLAPGSPFTGGGLSSPDSIAIDASGDIWATNVKYSTVSELQSDGSAAAASPFSAGGTAGPAGIAIDASGDVWVANGGVTELNSAGAPLTSAPLTGGGVNSPFGIAIDAAGSVWVTNENGNGISELDSTGSPRSPATAFGDTQPHKPLGVAIDASGNVWVTNSKYNSVTELVGAAAPTRTPLVTHIVPGGGFSP